jgi:hypothetical protein
LLKLFTHGHLFLFRLLLHAPFTLFLSITLDVLLESFAGLSLDVIHLLDIVFELLEVVEMVGESKILRWRGGYLQGGLEMFGADGLLAVGLTDLVGFVGQAHDEL